MTVHKSAKCIPPEGRRQVCLMQHRCNAFRNGSVGSLCNSILVGLISKCVLPLDTSSVAKSLPLIRHVLSSLIIPQCFDGGALLVLSICFKLLECSKCITLLLQWINSSVSAVVINEGDPVSPRHIPGVITIRPSELSSTVSVTQKRHLGNTQ